MAIAKIDSSGVAPSGSVEEAAVAEEAPSSVVAEAAPQDLASSFEVAAQAVSPLVIENGSVALNGVAVGAVDAASGQYAVTIDGNQFKGDVGTLLSAAVNGASSDVGRSELGPLSQLAQGLQGLIASGQEGDAKRIYGEKQREYGFTDAQFAPFTANLGLAGAGGFTPSQISEWASKPSPSTAATGVDALKKAYLETTGVPLTQPQLENLGWTKAITQPEFFELMHKQSAQVDAAYQKLLGRPPSIAEKLYWSNSTSSLDLNRSVFASSSAKLQNRELLEQLAKELPPVDATKFVAAGELPALPTRAGRASIENERLADEEKKPLVKPAFVTTPQEAAAFERVRELSKTLRGVDITGINADWAKQMIKTGTAQNPEFFKLTQTVSEAVRQAYQTHLKRTPTKAEMAEWLPFTVSMDANKKMAADVLERLKVRQNIEAMTAKIATR